LVVALVSRGDDLTRVVRHYHHYFVKVQSVEFQELETRDLSDPRIGATRASFVRL
jgi:hypothetical protein